jgi:hypothetical protein
MKHFKKLLQESQMLTIFEMLKKLEGFLQEKYSIKSFGSKKDNGFKLYMSKYLDEEKKEADLSEAIKKFIANECNLENVDVHKEQYGYHITFGHDAQGAKLIETTQADASGISGPNAKKTYICSFCGEEHEGYGNDPWPLVSDLESRACNKCNDSIVIPARLEKLYKSKKSKTEAMDRKEIEHAASNIVLDKKYIWLFNVMDDKGRDVEEGIEYLQDAIDSLISNRAAFLVAFPYVDPKPGDDTVDIVFADNPGPVIIYNNEEATIPKKELERPSRELKPKQEQEDTAEENQEEKTIKNEAYDDQDIRYQIVKNGEITENDIWDLEEAIEIAHNTNADYIMEIWDHMPTRIVWEREDWLLEEGINLEDARKVILEEWDEMPETYYRVGDQDIADLYEAIDIAIETGEDLVFEMRNGNIVRIVWESSDLFYDDEEYYDDDDDSYY